MVWNFIGQGGRKKKKKASNSQPFVVSIRGECKKISKQDFQDLLGQSQYSVISTDSQKLSQSVIFQHRQSNGHKSNNVGSSSSRPLFLDVPEGARILALLASSQRRSGSMLRLPLQRLEDKDPGNIDCAETLDFQMKEDEIEVGSKRWNTLDSVNFVFVDDSVPATAINTTSDLFAVAANSLELQRGGLKVECLTLLPPNPLFLALSLLSFGLELGSPLSWISQQSEESGIEKKIKKAYDWLLRRTKVLKNDSFGTDRLILTNRFDEAYQEVPVVWEKEKVKERLEQAALFHESSMQMGETLVCFPEKIDELCRLFDGIEECTFSLWDNFWEEALTKENLSAWQKERKQGARVERDYHVPVADTVAQEAGNSGTVPKSSNQSKNQQGAITDTKDEKLQHHSIRHFKKDIQAKAVRWFSTSLEDGENIPEFPSTNILALLFHLLGEHESVTKNEARKFKISLDDWEISCFKKKTGESLFRACFINDAVNLNPVFGRGKNKLPKWIKKNRGRPSKIAEAKACVPPAVAIPNMEEIHGVGLLFESIHDALKMEAAFWLELQFAHATSSSTRHWFMHTMDQMLHILLRHKEGSLNGAN